MIASKPACSTDSECRVGSTSSTITTSDQACCEAAKSYASTGSDDMSDWCPWKARVAARCTAGEADEMIASEPACDDAGGNAENGDVSGAEARSQPAFAIVVALKSAVLATVFASAFVL